LRLGFLLCDEPLLLDVEEDLLYEGPRVVLEFHSEVLLLKGKRECQVFEVLDYFGVAVGIKTV